jgi:hypothetical protein
LFLFRRGAQRNKRFFPRIAAFGSGGRLSISSFFDLASERSLRSAALIQIIREIDLLSFVNECSVQFKLTNIFYLSCGWLRCRPSEYLEGSRERWMKFFLLGFFSLVEGCLIIDGS